MIESLCVLTVHAHPDDEASKGAGTIARCQAEGIRTVLVCCTGGEEGEILNPAMDRDDIRDNLAAVRGAELAAAAEIIGYDTVHLLGYRDSGMPESEANFHADSFAVAPLDEAVDRLVALIRLERPQVIVTYPAEQGSYKHPDHLRVYEITHPAVTLAADPNHRRDLGASWAVTKTYYSVWSRARIQARHDAFLDLGLESPYDKHWFDRPNLDDQITTRVCIEGFAHVRRAGLLAHATQIDPESSFWFGLPEEVDAAIHPVDEYRLASGPDGGDSVEDDLFMGLRSNQQVSL